MKSYILSGLLFVFIAAGIYSCYSDNIIDLSGYGNEISVDGFITDEQGLALSGASIEFGILKTTSDSDGYFQFPATKHPGEVYIKVSKSGYFNGSRTLFVKDSKSVQLRISLLQKSFTRSFNSYIGGILDIAGKVKLEFAAQSITDQNGLDYNGNVNVAIKYLDPSDQTISSIMPGNLIGLKANDEMQGLGSFAMAAIELQSPSGSVLKIKESKQVNLKLAIPQSLQANAPTTIPLWYFDEARGLWREEGFAVKNGNYYEGMVHHFSFWNCDDYFPVLPLKGKLLDSKNIPLINANIKLTIAKNELSSYGTTNSDGLFEGMIPSNELLNMEVRDFCNNVIHNQFIGPFNTSANLGDIIIPSVDYTSIMISGEIVDSKLKVLPSILIRININGQLLKTKTNQFGKFNYALPACSKGEVSISILDYCNTEVYSNLLGTIDSNKDIGRIILPSGNFEQVAVYGTVVDCSNRVMPHVSVEVKSSQSIFSGFTDNYGKYVFAISICNTDSILITAYDNISGLYYSKAVSCVLPGSIHVSTLQICKNPPPPPPQSDEYLHVQFSDKAAGDFQYDLTLEDQLGVRHLFSNTTNPWFEIKWDGPGTVGNGTPIVELSFNTGNYFYVGKYQVKPNGNISFSKVPKVIGEFYEATFEAYEIKKIDLSTGLQLTSDLKVVGSFKIMKK